MIDLLRHRLLPLLPSDADMKRKRVQTDDDKLASGSVGKKAQYSRGRSESKGLDRSPGPDKPSVSSAQNGKALHARSSIENGGRQLATNGKSKLQKKEKVHGSDVRDGQAGVNAGGGLPKQGNKKINSNWLQMRPGIQHHPSQDKGKKGDPKVKAGAQQEKAGSQAPKAMVEEAQTTGKRPVPLNNNTSLTKVLAMDCEMVGVGVNGTRSMLAHVCLVNSHGNVVYEKYVRPMEEVTNYRTAVSGVRPRHLRGPNAVEFWTVQKEVGELLKGRILVGHALHNDLKVLLLSHPKRDIRDTQKFRPAGSKGGRWQSLKNMAQQVLSLTIQQGEHSPADDARAALYIYLHHRNEWEKSLLLRKTVRATGNIVLQKPDSR